MNDKWKLAYYCEIVKKCEDIIANEAIKWKTANDYNYYLFSTYAKAILVVKESLCLLQNGYPDGALSRAREVYEQMVIVMYIDNNYSDELIERYFADYYLKVYKNRKFLYEKLKDIDILFKEKYQKLEDECMQKINDLKQQYGVNTNDYWWVLDKSVNSFMNLQDKIGAELLIILYKRACISTHAGALSDIALLGRDNKGGSLLRTDQTWEGFEAPILLLMVSFDVLTHVIFKHFNLELPDEYGLKEKYSLYWETVFK